MEEAYEILDYLPFCIFKFYPMVHLPRMGKAIAQGNAMWMKL